LFLNPDTKLIGAAINVMLDHARLLQDAGIVGCRLLNGDLSVQTSSIRKFPTVLNQILQNEHLRLRWPGFPLWDIGPLFSENAAPAKVEATSGACMMIRREVFAEVGCFSEEYFMYSEDLDLCYKVKRAGYTNYYVGDATVIHFAGRSSRPEWALTMKCRSDLRFCALNRGRAYAVFFRVALIANAVARLAVIGVLSALRKLKGDEGSLREKAAKWRVVLKTLLAGGGDDVPPESSAKDAATDKADSVVS
jgi:GT2 family glycosyltransferase